ncbi:type I polyketide synthase [Pyxidicoccus sp. MSG2]|uniref:type I polyketide synthase n=1 Tax=Pyxidicoccus sp. MSG2 TaxID=2996790 RepID=UPI00226E3FC4|nr:beta-ketoacyl synthase N-terminal-like domain-containing protein [Pyxidicoccus sp. MSG2]MCY1016469.1 beta-ketoacyl synthase N-terminal-like domain-containing protein [Pyxidicoccus sp. MSG2]
MHETALDASPDEGAIAVVGISLRLPGASNVRRFWSNVASGVDSVTILDAEQRAKAGMPSEEGWVAAAGIIESPELFDAAFFGYSPREAEQLDPQHRLFMECAWEALESAGYAVRSSALHAGVYAGATLSTYLLRNVLPNMEERSSDLMESALGTNPDFLATRVAYKLNLTGPAMTVQTACSTSLTAVHLACQSLLAGECNLALAGGAAVRSPQLHPYRAQLGGLSSTDGRCRAFDEKASGTVPGNGVAVVALKRLADALADGDPIRAVIRGTAINNDGSNKPGFGAPSVSGQIAAITDAQALAGVEPRTLSYIEAHGTGTPLGDPVEVSALKQVFRGVAPGSVGLGSVKTNIGHLDAAAGVTGLIKAVLALENKLLPPTLHFTRPNPLLELEGSPFYVVSQPRPWNGPLPRRAGVSAFGIGGTNAHAVLEEAPALPPADPPRRDEELLLLSARSEEALERMSSELAEHLGHAPESLPDVAHTLQVGRNRFGWRRFVTASRKDDAVARLTASDSDKAPTAFDDTERRSAVFLFPGMGPQRVNMGAELLKEPAFRDAVDQCAEVVRRHLGSDPRELMFAGPERFDAASRELDRPLWAQPTLFTCEWALAQLWRSWGVEPEALLGHSMGEYAAACVAGVFTLEEALELVVARGRILEQLPPGGMTAALAPVAQVEPLLGPELSVAAINTPSACVVSGPLDALAAFEAALTGRGLESKRLRNARAGHSAMLEPHLADFARLVSRFSPRAPSVPLLSGLTGRWLTEREAVDPAYWSRHLRETVRFSDALSLVLASGERALIEMGPGNTLTSLARQHPALASQPVIAALPGTASRPGGLLAPLGEAWLAGVPIDWERFRDGERRRRVPLPTYSFDRERYWIEAATPAASSPRATEHRPVASSPATRRARKGAAPVPPRDATEAQLIECFQQVFHFDEVGIHDDFFALGGDSLIALRLTARIEERFGVRLSLRAVLEGPTVAQLAERVGASRDATPARETQPDCLVKLQAGSRGTPVFIVHGGAGQVLFYRDLARSISPERPIYGIESVGLTEGRPCQTSVEEMAAHYLDVIRKVYPTGPYLLVGASFGGMIVYEMAHRLSADGQSVPLCAMVDTPAPSQLGSWTFDGAELLSSLVRRAISAEQLRGLPLEEQFRLLHEHARKTGTEPVFPSLEQARRQIDVWLANGQAMSRYAPPRWEGGEVQYFLADETTPEKPDHAERGWMRLGAAVRVEVVPGDHTSMLLPPHAEGLGARLARLIR